MGQHEKGQEEREIEFSSDGFHTSRLMEPRRSPLPRKSHKWTDSERRWIALAMFEANNDIDEAIEIINKNYRKNYGAKNVCPSVTRPMMIGLTRGVNFEAYLTNVAEEGITGRLMQLSKSTDERVSADASKYLMDRAKGKATARVEIKSLSITISEQSKKALDIIKQRKNIWKNPSGEESPG